MGNLTTTDYWAQRAVEAAQAEPPPFSPFLSTKGGILAVSGDVFPGNQIAAVVLDAVRENNYYTGVYDPDAKVSPTCYAFGRSEADMAPHPAMAQHPHFVAQHSQCLGCPQAQFGSAPQGKGKACKQRRRLTLLPAGWFEPRKGSRDFDFHVIDDPRHYRTEQVAYLKLPVMSVLNWSNYVQLVAQKHQRPPQGVVTRVYIEPDPKSQYRVHFEAMGLVPDDLAEIVMARADEAAAQAQQPYAPPQDPTAAPRTGFRDVRK